MQFEYYKNSFYKLIHFHLILLLPIGIIYSTKGIGQVIIVYSINFNYNLNTIKVLPTAVIITHIEVL